MFRDENTKGPFLLTCEIGVSKETPCDGKLLTSNVGLVFNRIGDIKVASRRGNLSRNILETRSNAQVSKGSLNGARILPQNNLQSMTTKEL
jgi:hypothetical protein